MLIYLCRYITSFIDAVLRLSHMTRLTGMCISRNHVVSNIYSPPLKVELLSVCQVSRCSWVVRKYYGSAKVAVTWSLVLDF